MKTEEAAKTRSARRSGEPKVKPLPSEKQNLLHDFLHRTSGAWVEAALTFSAEKDEKVRKQAAFQVDSGTELLRPNTRGKQPTRGASSKRASQRF